MAETNPLAFLNDYSIKISQLKAKAFYMFHKCSFICYSPKEKNTPQCLKQCRFELDEFFKLQYKTYPEVDQVFVGPSSIEQDLRQQYVNVCRGTEQKLNKHISDLNEVLDKLLE